MRLLFGVAVAMGIGAAGVLGLPELDSRDSRDSLAVVTDVGVGGMAQVSVRDRSASVETGSLDAQSADLGRVAALRPAGVVRASVEPTSAASIGRWAAPRMEPIPAAVVVLQSAVGATGARVGVGEPDKETLIRDLQRALKRVGCYVGEVDGDWGPASRAGMQSFVTRMNASLPFEEPDFILLTLVQGHAGTACRDGTMLADRQPANQPRSLIVPVPVPVARINIQPVQSPAAMRNVASVQPEILPSRLDSTLSSSFDGRMAIGGPASGVLAPAPAVRRAYRAPRVVQRAAPQSRSSRRRRDSSWTAKFFDN